MATLQELLLAKLMEKNGRAPASFGDSMFPEASPTPQPYYGSKLNYQESLPPEPTHSQEEEAPLPQSLSQPSKLYAAPFDLTRPNKSSASEDDILKAQLLREPIQEQQQQQQVAQQDPSIAAATDEYKLAELLRNQQLSMMGGMSSAFKKNQAQLSDDIALQRKLMQLEAGRAPANDPSGTIGMYLANAGYKPSEIQAATKQYQPEDEGKTADRLRKSLEGVSNLQDKMTDNDVQRLKIGLSMAQNKASGAESSKMFKRLTDFQKAIDPSQASGKKGLGADWKTVQSVEKALAIPLSEAAKTGDLNLMTNQQVRELYEALANVVSGGGTSSEGRIEALVPKTAMMSIQGLKQFLSNQPKGAKAKEFVKNAMEMLSREREGAQYRIQRTIHGIIPAYADVAANPTTQTHYREILKRMGVDPEKSPAAPFDYTDEGVAAAVGGSKINKIDINTASPEELRAYLGEE